MLLSKTLWPTEGISRNVWEQLALYQQFQSHNLSGMIDSKQLAKATEAVLTTYSAHMLCELRPYTMQLSKMQRMRSDGNDI